MALPELRSSARARTAHLGLSELDLEGEDGGAHSAVPGTGNEEREQQHAALIPGSLRHAALQKPTVTDLLKHEHAATQFRLSALVDEFCDPIDEALGSHDRLLPSSNDDQGRSSSLDCLAAGCLAVMLHAAVPHAWLREGILSRHCKLQSYAESVLACIRSPNGSMTVVPRISPETKFRLRGPPDRNSLVRFAVHSFPESVQSLFSPMYSSVANPE